MLTIDKFLFFNVYYSMLEIWPLFFCWYVQVAEFILSCCNPWLNSQVQKMLMLEPLGHSAIWRIDPRSILTSIPMSLFHCLQKMIYWLFLCHVSNYLIDYHIKDQLTSSAWFLYSKVPSQINENIFGLFMVTVVPAGHMVL